MLMTQTDRLTDYMDIVVAKAPFLYCVRLNNGALWLTSIQAVFWRSQIKPVRGKPPRNAGSDELTEPTHWQ